MTTGTMTAGLIGLPDVAARLGRSWGQTYSDALAGVIGRPVRIGRHWYLREEDVARYAREHQAAAR